MGDVISKSFLIIAVVFFTLSLTSAPARANDDPVKAVRGWYEIVKRGSWVEAGDGGTLGGPERYRRGYQMLAQSFRTRVGEKSFLDRFTHTVYIRLDQAELINADGKHATVFVEDERDMLLDNLPATVRYYGSITLVRDRNGWVIDGFNIVPEESMIALRDFGHGSEGAIIDTAWVPIARYLGVKSIDFRRTPHAPEHRSGTCNRHV